MQLLPYQGVLVGVRVDPGTRLQKSDPVLLEPSPGHALLQGADSLLCFDGKGCTDVKTDSQSRTDPEMEIVTEPSVQPILLVQAAIRTPETSRCTGAVDDLAPLSLQIMRLHRPFFSTRCCRDCRTQQHLTRYPLVGPLVCSRPVTR